MDFIKRRLDDWREARRARREAAAEELRRVGARAMEKIASRRRTAWLPVLEDGPGEPDGSRFGGVPWLATGEPWPACGTCGRPAQFFVQLAGVPEGAGPSPSGLAQVFFCTHCYGWSPYDASHVLRVVAPGAGAPGQAPPGLEAFPPRRVVGWEERDDYPVFFFLEEGELSEEEAEALSELGHPIAGDKLRGWPETTQEPVRAECRRCGAEMLHLLQIDSCQALPHMWGDAGLAHVMQCPEHPDELALYWDCT